MMEILSILLILAVILIAFKLLGLIFKTGIFILTIPLQIIAVIVIFILCITLFPIIITFITAAILVPVGLLAPLLPLLAIGFGIYLLLK
jgi:hypothetical protein